MPREKRSKTDKERLAIRAVLALGVVYARGFQRLEVLSPAKLPAHGPAILVCNHTSALDPVFIQSVCRRRITWMMAREYYDMPALNWGFRLLQTIPVQRSGRDLSATRAAIRALHEGGIVGIFPEGRIEESPELLPFQTGVAMMAIKTRVPVIPAYLDGSQRGRGMLTAFLSANHARIAFGAAFHLDNASTERSELEIATEEIRWRVENLREILLANSAMSG